MGRLVATAFAAGALLTLLVPESHAQSSMRGMGLHNFT